MVYVGDYKMVGLANSPVYASGGCCTLCPVASADLAVSMSEVGESYVALPLAFPEWSTDEVDDNACAMPVSIVVPNNDDI